MTYFWIQMTHFAMASTNMDNWKEAPRSNTENPDEEFQEFNVFLERNPHLMNGGLFLEYYSRELMLQTPESRTEMRLPDLRPLPSIVGGAPGGTPATTAAAAAPVGAVGGR
eukprot:TRINITY_DN22_c0_g3_i1.p1 TRINITY_DN22_c0_g3~~TRINITY_DN22_c0_g3_i1.p1  ORF type:complete len:111 (+),score=18.05 TRINITY_DN22_c0_g3_i1:454-786(+)